MKLVTLTQNKDTSFLYGKDLSNIVNSIYSDLSRVDVNKKFTRQDVNDVEFQLEKAKLDTENAEKWLNARLKIEQELVKKIQAFKKYMEQSNKAREQIISSFKEIIALHNSLKVFEAQMLGSADMNAKESRSKASRYRRLASEY